MSAPDPRLSINQATIKHADLATALRVTAEAGVEAIGLWREPVHEVGLEAAARMLTDSGLRFTTHCRGGFFTLPEGAARRAAIDDNRVAIDEARDPRRGRRARVHGDPRARRRRHPRGVSRSDRGT
jgi:sugar phosphate isomerase/epimerase